MKKFQEDGERRKNEQDSGHPSPQMLSVGAVANLLSCSKRSIYRLVDNNKMPKPVKLGSLNRWRRSEIEEWIHNGCKPVMKLHWGSTTLQVDRKGEQQ